MIECKRCGAEKAITATWGDPLCDRCAQLVSVMLDRLGRWPPDDWKADDLASGVLDSEADR